MARARTYDPAQGRFTAPDPANVHNRYTAFDTNPVMKSDPTGQSAIADYIIDSLYILTFAAAVYFTGGAALAAGSALWGAFTAGEDTAAAVGLFVTNAVAVGANAVGLASNAARLVDDVKTTVSGKGFFSKDTRDDLSNIATVAGSVAGIASMGAAAAQESIDEAAAAAKAATQAPAPGQPAPTVPNAGAGVPNGAPGDAPPLNVPQGNADVPNAGLNQNQQFGGREP